MSNTKPIQIDAQWSIPQAIAALEGAPSLVVNTSGSTGNAKSISISRSAFIASAHASNKRIGAVAGDTWSLLLPLSHIAGVNVLVRAMLLGTIPIDLRTEKNYVNVDYTAVVPTQLHRALHGDTELLSHLQNAKTVLVGGAPLSHGERSAAENANINIVTTYGMTETCGGCIYDGLALDGVEFNVVDGVIHLRGITLADIPLVDGWFHTSDRGRIENGKLIVEGRIDDQIISGGEKISLSAIENALKAKFTAEFVAYAKPDREWGERLCLAKTADIADYEITSYLKTTFGPHVSPKEIVKVNTIPLIGIGKPDRKKLAES